MVVLEVGIDAQGAVTGSQQAGNAINSLAASIAAASGQFGKANGGLAAFGRTMGGLAAGLGVATAALGAVSLAMSTFEKRAAAAKAKADDFTRSIKEWKSAIEGVLTSGGGGGGGAGGDRLSAAMAYLAKADAAGVMAGVRFGARFRGDPANYALMGDIGAQFPELRNIINQQQGLSGTYGMLTDEQGNIIGGAEEQRIVSNEAITAGLRQYVKRNYYGGPQANEQFTWAGRYGGGFGARIGPGYYGPDIPGVAGDPAGEYSGLGPFQTGTTGNAMSLAGAQQWRDEQKAQSAQQAQQAADQLLSTALQISDTFADGVTNLAFGLQDARQVAAGLLYDLARGLSREAMGRLTTSIVNSFN